MRRQFPLLTAGVCLGAILLSTGCRQPAAAPAAPRPPQAIINPFLGPTTLPPPAMPPEAFNNSSGVGAAGASAAPAIPVDNSNLPGPGSASDVRAGDDGGWKASAVEPASANRDLHASVTPLRLGSTVKQAVYQEDLPEAPKSRIGDLASSPGERYLSSTRANGEALPPAGASDVRLATHQETSPAGSSLGKARGSAGWGPAMKKDAAGAVVGAPASSEPRALVPPADAELLPLPGSTSGGYSAPASYTAPAASTTTAPAPAMRVRIP